MWRVARDGHPGWCAEAAASFAPASGLLNSKRVRELLGEPIDSSGFGQARRAAEIALGLNRWLRRYPARIAV